MAGAKRSSKGAKGSRRGGSKGGGAPEFRSEALAQALERQDMAAVALALRHGNTVYLMKPEEMPAGKFLAGIYHWPMARHGKRS